jgi:hypothetical protein
MGCISSIKYLTKIGQCVRFLNVISLQSPTAHIIRSPTTYQANFQCSSDANGELVDFRIPSHDFGARDAVEGLTNTLRKRNAQKRD